MRKITQILTLVLFLLAWTGISSAGIVNLALVTGWSFVDSFTVIVYQWSRPIGLLKFDCPITSVSMIQIVEPIALIGSPIGINGRVCHIMKAESF